MRQDRPDMTVLMGILPAAFGTGPVLALALATPLPLLLALISPLA